jgi:putative acetyltransferase
MPATELTIREFEPGDEIHFLQLNEEWILRYFGLEAKDQSTLNDPRGNILDPGGKILFAVLNNEVVGCCALLAMGPGEFELAKMAVRPSCQRAGVGRRMMQEAIDRARSLDATRLYLETNHSLTPAITLYESMGFRHLPPERVLPSPYARADVFMELFLRPQSR